jgi:hypothetical protein
MSDHQSPPQADGGQGATSCLGETQEGNRQKTIPSWPSPSIISPNVIKRPRESAKVRGVQPGSMQEGEPCGLVGSGGNKDKFRHHFFFVSTVVWDRGSIRWDVKPLPSHSFQIETKAQLKRAGVLEFRCNGPTRLQFIYLGVASVEFL